MQTITLPAGRPNSARAAAFIQSLPVDQAWRVVVESWKPRRSDQQNRYLWGYVYPQFLAQLDGWDAEDIHEYFLGECYGWETLEGFGKKRMKPIRRSSRLSKQEFSDYVAFIQRKGAELGVFIDDPEM
jgi:hypothetical protein